MPCSTQDIRILPSLLAANLLYLHEEINHLIDAGSQLLHIDVMDNHYVPNLTFGPMLAQSIKTQLQIALDIHLMVTPIDPLITQFAPYAQQIAFHPDATVHVDRSIQLIKDHNCLAGLALNPHTSLDCLTYCAQTLDYVLIMTVNPGFGGQTLIPYVIPKINQIRQLYPHLRIAVDGGVNATNIAALSAAGASDFVAGHAIFQDKEYKKNIDVLQQLATQV